MTMEIVQPSLFDDLTQIHQPRMARGATIQERFEAFHRANPQVYSALKTLSLQMLGTGVSRYGIKGLVERLRWEFAIVTKGDNFKICNSYTSRYARLLVEESPQLDGFFELRELREEKRNG